MPELDRHTRPGDIEIIGAEVEELKLVLYEAIEDIKKARPIKECGECGAMFALAPVKGQVPKWLMIEAVWIEFQMGVIV